MTALILNKISRYVTSMNTTLEIVIKINEINIKVEKVQ